MVGRQKVKQHQTKIHKDEVTERRGQIDVMQSVTLYPKRQKRKDSGGGVISFTRFKPYQLKKWKKIVLSINQREHSRHGVMARLKAAPKLDRHCFAMQRRRRLTDGLHLLVGQPSSRADDCNLKLLKASERRAFSAKSAR